MFVYHRKLLHQINGCIIAAVIEGYTYCCFHSTHWEPEHTYVKKDAILLQMLAFRVRSVMPQILLLVFLLCILAVQCCSGLSTVFVGLEESAKILARNIADETVHTVQHKWVLDSAVSLACLLTTVLCICVVATVQGNSVIQLPPPLIEAGGIINILHSIYSGTDWVRLNFLSKNRIK